MNSGLVHTRIEVNVPFFWSPIDVMEKDFRGLNNI